MVQSLSSQLNPYLIAINNNRGLTQNAINRYILKYITTNIYVLPDMGS